MVVKKTEIDGVFLIELNPILDSRGYFTRVFDRDVLEKVGVNYNIVQVSRSLTLKKGMIRGIHFQRSPMQEDKIVQCLNGSIFDVVLDIRPKSKTFGKWISEILSAKNKKMLLIPKGCAHGFQALENNCLIEYFFSQYYSPKHESGLLWNDPKFGIKWPIKNPFLSEKDKKWALYTKQ